MPHSYLSDIMLVIKICILLLFFFFNDTATTEIYTLSLHDALPISAIGVGGEQRLVPLVLRPVDVAFVMIADQHVPRSEEHTSELQSRQYLVCRLLLEKKKKKIYNYKSTTKAYNFIRFIFITHSTTC